MVIIPPGWFTMGLEDAQQPYPDHELPPTMTNIKYGFYVDVTPVTWLEYLHVRRNKNNTPEPIQANASLADEAVLNQPMTSFTRIQAQKYAQVVGKRLLTEAEFEYVSRGGQNGSLYPWGSETEINHEYGNFVGQASLDRWNCICPVAQFKPNRFGVFDMHGNVWEMVAGLWKDNLGDGAKTQKFFIPIRGGSSSSSAYRNRFSARIRWPANGTGNLGFRMAIPVLTASSVTN